MSPRCIAEMSPRCAAEMHADRIAAASRLYLGYISAVSRLERVLAEHEPDGDQYAVDRGFVNDVVEGREDADVEEEEPRERVEYGVARLSDIAEI